MSVLTPRFSPTRFAAGPAPLDAVRLDRPRGRVLDANERTIALVFGADRDEAAANLQLFTASPAMFFALRELVIGLECGCGPDDLEPQLIAAQQALAMAAAETNDPRVTLGAAA